MSAAFVAVRPGAIEAEMAREEREMKRQDQLKLPWAPPASLDKAKELERVKGRIASAIRSFFAPMVPGSRFHMKELTEHVARVHDGYVAPDSPGRILRAMRKSGELEVDLVNRSQSLYAFKGAR